MSQSHKKHKKHTVLPEVLSMYKSKEAASCFFNPRSTSPVGLTLQTWLSRLSSVFFDGLSFSHITQDYGLAQALLVAMKFGMKKDWLWFAFCLFYSKVCCWSPSEAVEPWLVSHHVILLGGRVLLEELVYNLSFPLPWILLFFALLVEHVQDVTGNSMLITHLLPFLAFSLVSVFTISVFLFGLRTTPSSDPSRCASCSFEASPCFHSLAWSMMELLFDGLGSGLGAGLGGSAFEGFFKTIFAFGSLLLGAALAFAGFFFTGPALFLTVSSTPRTLSASATSGVACTASEGASTDGSSGLSVSMAEAGRFILPIVGCESTFNSCLPWMWMHMLQDVLVGNWLEQRSKISQWFWTCVCSCAIVFKKCLQNGVPTWPVSAYKVPKCKQNSVPEYLQSA